MEPEGVCTAQPLSRAATTNREANVFMAGFEGKESRHSIRQGAPMLLSLRVPRSECEFVGSALAIVRPSPTQTDAAA